MGGAQKIETVIWPLGNKTKVSKKVTCEFKVAVRALSNATFLSGKHRNIDEICILSKKNFLSYVLKHKNKKKHSKQVPKILLLVAHCNTTLPRNHQDNRAIVQRTRFYHQHNTRASPV